MKQFVFVFLLLFVSILEMNGQKKNFMDSVKVIKSDSVRIHIILNKVNEIKYNNPELGIKYAEVSVRDAKKIKNIPLEARAYILKGVCMEKMSRTDSSIFYYNKALTLSKSSGNIKGIASAYNNLGLSYHALMQYEKALSYFIASEEYFLKLKDDKNIAKLYTNIGMVKSKLNDNKSAMEYFEKALKLAKKNEDFFGVGAIYNNMSETFYSKGDLENAKHYLTLSLAAHKKNEDKFGTSNVLLNLGNVLYDMKNNNGAQQYLKESIEMKRGLQDAAGLAKSYLFLAKINEDNNAHNNYKLYLDSALHFVNKEKLPEEQMQIYQELSQYYERNKTNDSSLFYYKKYAELYATNYNDSNSIRVNELNAKYETAKKENTIQMQENDLKLKNNLILYSSLTLGLLGVLGYSGYRRRELQKKNILNEKLLELQLEHSKEVLQAEEKERQKIADELHDSTGQVLSVIKMKTDLYEEKYALDNDKQIKDLESIKLLVDRACQEIRTFSHQLKSIELERFGLYGAIEKLLNEVKSDKLTTEFDSQDSMIILGPQEQIILYRIIQEAVKNVITHARASRLKVTATKEGDQLILKMEDNGIGFNTQKMSKGIGLQNMKNRMSFLGGSITMQSEMNKGTIIVLTVPENKNDVT